MSVDNTKRALRAKKLRSLYPDIQPYDKGFLPVSRLHTVYYEQSGNPRGKPVVVLHGGPGGGSQPFYRQYFNPRRWRIIQFDQRGCGKSTPRAELRGNTTWDLVQDIETLREKLDIDRWTVFGGSWGSTLALVYAETHPHHVIGLILRGVFLFRKKEIDWLYENGEGASAIFADAYEEFQKIIPPGERGAMVKAYYKRLTSTDRAVRRKAARVWSQWEAQTSKLFPDPKLVKDFGAEGFADAFARIECHYFIRGGFLTDENQIYRNTKKIRHIPTIIVQGRYDIVCPMVSAWELHRALPKSNLVIVPDAGHSVTEPGITHHLIEATDRMARK